MIVRRTVHRAAADSTHGEEPPARKKSSLPPQRVFVALRRAESNDLQVGSDLRLSCRVSVGEIADHKSLSRAVPPVSENVGLAEQTADSANFADIRFGRQLDVVNFVIGMKLAEADADGLCCNWFLCFDGPASSPDCDCGLGQSADFKAFCVVNINVLPPDGPDEHYKVVVEFTSGGADETVCGDCHFVTGRTIFQKDYGLVDDGRPDCMDWTDEPIPLAITFGDYCKAADRASVYLTAI